MVSRLFGINELLSIKSIGIKNIHMNQNLIKCVDKTSKLLNLQINLDNDVNLDYFVKFNRQLYESMNLKIIRKLTLICEIEKTNIFEIFLKNMQSNISDK